MTSKKNKQDLIGKFLSVGLIAISPFLGGCPPAGYEISMDRWMDAAYPRGPFSRRKRGPPREMIRTPRGTLGYLNPQGYIVERLDPNDKKFIIYKNGEMLAGEFKVDKYQGNYWVFPGHMPVNERAKEIRRFLR